MFSARARAHGAPHRRLRGVVYLAAICNELCYRVSQLSRPLHAGRDAAAEPRRDATKTCIPELVKCVEQYGNVAINLIPIRRAATDQPAAVGPFVYPIYEKMVEYGIPAMIHVSTSCNHCFHHAAPTI
ncbi:amidohydrolase family protein [Burkholderia plantarii]|uniref:amidohydrolase family protein n=1 Tax=Burkholderia plantarii TaxID=41899 RepID=UPI001F5B4E3F|nr:amidohydrolase family protein [Burkholderia plantarii]